jgi:hypothetical protein
VLLNSASPWRSEQRPNHWLATTAAERLSRINCIPARIAKHGSSPFSSSTKNTTVVLQRFRVLSIIPNNEKAARQQGSLFFKGE